MSARVEVFVIGAQKAGTTALQGLMTRHPGLRMSRDKEVHHFDRSPVDWSRPDHRRLHDQFDWTESGVLRGEATPAYLFWPPALPRLQAYNPEARLIVGLRHPSLRAVSHWRMERRRGRESLDFAAAISPRGRARIASASQDDHMDFSYVERGFYAPQIARLFDLFARDQVLFYRVDDLWLRPAAVLGRIERHLGLAPHAWPHRPDYVAPVSGETTAPIAPALRAALDRGYAADQALTEALTGCDLADWRDPFYAEPMRPAAPSGAAL